MFILVTIDLVYVNSVRFKHINCPYCFLELNYRSFNLKQRLIDEDIESNPGPTQNDCKPLVGRPRKIKVFKGTKKNCGLSENINVNVPSDLRAQYFF